tara:strand:+ start:507 stop:1145 length:639 start_codon:yes stop_codon:yes gene_type:complete
MATSYTFTGIENLDENSLITSLEFSKDYLYAIIVEVGGTFQLYSEESGLSTTQTTYDNTDNIENGDVGVAYYEMVDYDDVSFIEYYSFTENSLGLSIDEDNDTYLLVNYDSDEVSKLIERFGDSNLIASDSSDIDDLIELSFTNNYENAIDSLVEEVMDTSLSPGYTFKKVYVAPFDEEEIRTITGTEPTETMTPTATATTSMVGDFGGTIY